MERLNDLEANLGPDLVASLAAEAAQAGGEQYRPREAAISCKDLPAFSPRV